MDGMKGGFALGEPEKIDTPENEAKTPEQVEAELRLNTAVLAEAVKTMVERFSTSTSANVVSYKTPVVSVQIGDETVEAFASYTNGYMSSQNILIHDSETGESRLWFNFNLRFNGDTNRAEIDITDGSRRYVETPEELAFIRELVDKMMRAYFDKAFAETDKLDVGKHLKETVDAKIKETEAKLASLYTQRQRLSETISRINVFHVVIRHAWKNEGGRDLDEIIVADSLSDVIVKAVARFEDINDSAPAQSLSQRINIVLGKDSGTEIEIPRIVYAPLFRALSQHDSEQALIERMSTGNS